MKHLLVYTAMLLAPLAALPASDKAAFFEQHCYDCHGADEKKGGLDLTSLALKLDDRANFETWVKIHDAIANGEMPPKKKVRPPETETKALLADLDAKLIAADEARIAKDGGRAVFRRLTRVEYENALRDLLALPHLEICKPVQKNDAGSKMTSSPIPSNPWHHRAAWMMPANHQPTSCPSTNLTL